MTAETPSVTSATSWLVSHSLVKPVPKFGRDRSEGVGVLAAALEAEVDALRVGHALFDELDDNEKRLVVRNGHAEGRRDVPGAGPGWR